MSNNEQHGIAQPQTLQQMVPLVVDLKAEVEALLARYVNDPAKPPFSPAELMVMAWVCRPEQNSDRVSDRQISDWIVTTFEYYKKLALEDVYKFQYLYSRNCYGAREPGTELQSLAYDRRDLEGRYDVPLVTATIPERDTGRQSHISTSASCRTFLRRTLNAELQQFPRFLDLPPDIRVMIYEEALYLSGDLEPHFPFHWNSASDPRLTVASTAKLTSNMSVPDWIEEPSRKSGERSEIRFAVDASRFMALFLVNRQIHNESVPIFYKINRFHAHSVSDLVKVLSLCGSERAHYFTHISFTYWNSKTDESNANTAFSLLKQCKGLSKLQMTAQDWIFFGRPWPRHNSRFNSVDEIPGMKVLGGIRVESFECSGNCPKIQAYLLERMLK